MLTMTASDGAPLFASRWTVRGCAPDGQCCTTIFDLAVDGKHLIVYPAAIAMFALVLDPAAVDMLTSIVEGRRAGAVRGMHPHHGKRLLGAAPHTGSFEPSWTDRPADAPPYLGPVELYVNLPGDQSVCCVFRAAAYLALVETLHEVSSCLHEHRDSTPPLRRYHRGLGVRVSDRHP